LIGRRGRKKLIATCPKNFLFKDRGAIALNPAANALPKVWGKREKAKSTKDYNMGARKKRHKTARIEATQNKKKIEAETTP